MKSFFLLLTLQSYILLFSCSWTPGDTSSSASKQAGLSSSLSEHTDILFMMYLDGDNNLHDYAWENLINAQKALSNLSSDFKITVLALIDGNSQYANKYQKDGKSYLLTLGGYSAAELKNASLPALAAATIDHSKTEKWIYNGTGTGSQEIDMSAGNTLHNFLRWSKANYKADKTIFIIQNHGGGPYIESFTSISNRALCWDETTGTKRYLSNNDIANAISWTFGKVDLLVEDVCNEGAIELIYGLQDIADYIIASPNITRTCSYNYDKIISYAASTSSIPDIGKKLIDYNKETVENENLKKPQIKDNDSACTEFSLTLIDCSKKSTLLNIKNHTSQLAAAILADTDSMKSFYRQNRIGKLKKNTADNFYGFSYETKYFYTQDLGLLAYMLGYKSEGASEDVTNAARNLYDDFKNGGLIAYGWAGGKENSWYYSGNSSYGSDNENSSFLKISDGKCPWGISITCDYLIYNDASGKKYIYQIDDYGSWTTFAAGNRWADLLKTYWREVTGK